MAIYDTTANCPQRRNAKSNASDKREYRESPKLHELSSAIAKMSDSNETLRCLMCDQRQPKHYFIYHVHEHLNYAQHACEDCGYTCINYNDMDRHSTTKGHRFTPHNRRNEFMDRLCQIAMADTYYAARHGVNAVFECDVRRPLGMHIDRNRDNAGPSNIARNIIHNRNSSPGTAERKRSSQGFRGDHTPPTSLKRNRTEAARQPSRDPSNDDVVLVEPPEAAFPRRAVSRSPQKRSNGLVAIANGRRNPFEIAERTMRDLEFAITGGEARKACRKCGEKVKNNFASRREHVLRRHVDLELSEADRIEDQKLQHRRCFPNAKAVDELQCDACGHRDLESENGRVYHVGKHHANLPFSCPFPDCPFEEDPGYPDAMWNRHVKTSAHNVKRKSDVPLDVQLRWSESRRHFEEAIKPLVTKCFPAELTLKPGKRQSSQHARANETDEEEFFEDDPPQDLVDINRSCSKNASAPATLPKNNQVRQEPRRQTTNRTSNEGDPTVNGRMQQRASGLGGNFLPTNNYDAGSSRTIERNDPPRQSMRTETIHSLINDHRPPRPTVGAQSCTSGNGKSNASAASSSASSKSAVSPRKDQPSQGTTKAPAGNADHRGQNRHLQNSSAKHRPAEVKDEAEEIYIVEQHPRRPAKDRRPFNCNNNRNVTRH